MNQTLRSGVGNNEEMCTQNLVVRARDDHGNLLDHENMFVGSPVTYTNPNMRELLGKIHKRKDYRTCEATVRGYYGKSKKSWCPFSLCDYCDRMPGWPEYGESWARQFHAAESQ